MILNPEATAELLNEALTTGELNQLIVALRQAIQARGVAEIAKDIGVDYDFLCEALNCDDAAHTDTLRQVCIAMLKGRAQA